MNNKTIEFLQSEQGEQLGKILAYAIQNTPTEKDNQVIDAGQAVSNWISDLDEEVTTREAMKAGVSILKLLAEKTKTKWDDRALKALDALL